MGKVKFGMSTCIGEVAIGLPYPVFYDPHYPIQLNNPPVTLATGSPGSGKTFFGLTLAGHASVLGKIGVILDPKGDFVALKTLERAGLIGEVSIWSVTDSSGEVVEENIGMLDPTIFSDRVSSNTALTLDTIRELNGDLTPKQINEVTPIVRDVVENRDPSFSKVVNKLKSYRDDEVRSLGYTLETKLNTPLAKLLVADKRVKRRPFVLKRGFVVVDLHDLKIPDESKPSKEYSSEERVSIIIMGLLGNLITGLMHDKAFKRVRKLLIIDEAWAVVATKSGKSMVNSVARLGRSLNMATVLLTQSTKSLSIDKGNDLNTMISVRFAFRNNDESDNEVTCGFMKLPSGEGWEELVRDLNTGECLMQDVLGQTAVIHVLAEDDWVDAFNTNPIG